MPTPPRRPARVPALSIRSVQTTQLLESETVGAFFREALARRRRTRPELSLRWVAQKLKLSAALLSQIGKDRRSFPGERVEEAAKALALNAIETEYFHVLIEEAASRTAKGKKAHAERREKLRNQVRITHQRAARKEDISLIRDWVTLAAYAGFDLAGLETSEAALERALGVTAPRVRAGLQQLQAAGLVEPGDAPGRWKLRETGDVRLEAFYPNRQFRDYYSQILALADRANRHPKTRYTCVGIETFAFPSSEFARLRQEMRKFNRHISALAKQLERKGAKRDTVFQSYVQFFDVTAAR